MEHVNAPSLADSPRLHLLPPRPRIASRLSLLKRLIHRPFFLLVRQPLLLESSVDELVDV
jgi:hypothetical protein